MDNKRKDYSIRKPIQSVEGLLSVTDSANIDFTFFNNNLTADLTLTGVVAGTYGDASNIPVLQIDQWGRITGVTLVPVSGGGSTYTVDNGLTENPLGNFQLGSTISGGAPLLHDTYIDTLTDKTLFLEGQKTNQLEYILDVSNTTNDGGALRVTSLGLGIAITATSVSASAIAANSTNAPAVAASTGGSNEAGLFTNSDAGTNNIVQGIRLRHSSSGIPTSGFGVSAEFSGKTTINSDLRLGRLSFVWTDAITASRTSKFQIHTVNSGVESVKVEVSGNGQTKLNSYGSGTFTGTATKFLAVDASGNVIEENAPSGGGGVTSVGLSVPSPASPAFSVSGSPVTTSGTLQINALGTAGQVIRGDGSLGTIAPNDAIYPTMTSVYLSDVNPLNIHAAGSINRLYLPAFATNTIKLYDTSSNQLVATIALIGPQSVFRIVSNGELIATQLLASGLTRYNASTGALIGSVAGGGTRGTDFVEYSATKLFITNSGSNNLSVYNPTTNVFDATIAGVGTFPFGICWNQNGASAHNGLLVITAVSSNGVSIVNPATNTLVAGAVNPSGALNGPFGIAYAPTSDQYYVASQTGDKIDILAPASSTTFSYVKSIRGIKSPRWIRYSSLTGYLYVGFGATAVSTTDASTFVAVIDPSTDSIIRICNTSSYNTVNVQVHNLELDDVNGYIYVNGYGGSVGSNITTQLKIQP